MEGSTVIWTDIGAFAVLAAQLVLLAAAAIVAKSQAKEARRLREAQTRPLVVLHFETDDELFYLALTNFGTTLARNIKIAVTPVLASALDDGTDNVRSLQMLKESGIPTLAPGREIRTLFDSAFTRKPELGLPDLYTARIEYDDHALERHFDEEIALDLGVHWGLGRIEKPGIPDIHNRLKELVAEVRKWTVSGGGLLALSQQDIDERRAAWRARAEEVQRREAEARTDQAPT